MTAEPRLQGACGLAQGGGERRDVSGGDAADIILRAPFQAGGRRRHPGGADIVAHRLERMGGAGCGRPIAGLHGAREIRGRLGRMLEIEPEHAGHKIVAAHLGHGIELLQACGTVSYTHLTLPTKRIV